MSNAGKKRGRGKRGATKKRINLYAGKGFGYSELNSLITSLPVIELSLNER